MIICRTKEDLKRQMAAYRKVGASIGFVPTMGYLHEGHASLMRKSKEQNEITVLSIFVNPLQFGPNEDLDRYPKDEARDLALAESNGVDAVFLPSVAEMYPTKPLTSLMVAQITDRLCGASRPGHFDGVGLVVSKLFHLVAPDRAYFGMKDAQQVAVIQQMVSDLDMPVEIVPCPIVREPDGLALSSRNVYLSAEQRSQAVVLSQALKHASDWYQEPGMNAERLQAKVKLHISKASDAVIDYVELLHYPNLDALSQTKPLTDDSQPLLLALAVKFGATRLIDNCLLERTEVQDYVQNDDEIEAAPGHGYGSEPELCR
ncbi:pantoate--beta-alanine ligase [Paenibacillus harenae]|uniref:Pantothenate synthetase n=1 Tax=Paenibacillus harenae TaxID=306543 RepID=A0ABT9TVV7_PAEHA|nr:pantoate--beta-alanine ligase [Paenibacillus harenae]MDQ0111497.1 pantoate--beta-alanine ligase [Paenibacillus harenae]